MPASIIVKLERLTVDSSCFGGQDSKQPIVTARGVAVIEPDSLILTFTHGALQLKYISLLELNSRIVKCCELCLDQRVDCHWLELSLDGPTFHHLLLHELWIIL